MKQEKQEKRDSIKFTIATDVHLGHLENHDIRKQDSFHAFEEVLSISTEQQADFLLLGGDLFDEVNPSQKTIYKCLNLLQKYVQGERKSTLRAKYQEDPDYKINFENHNMNIRLPILTIHGNHDYPSNDFGKLSICDLLHVSNYANYFGKHTNLNEIVVKPFILEKPGFAMKVAIYGLGYIKDAVLNELFEHKKVKFQEVQPKNQYFCLFIFHQNRYKKGLRPGAPALKCIHSKNIPHWMDLTIWGHEHEAIDKIQIEDGRKIFQPGSTVITSCIQAESYMKQCLMIEIFDRDVVDLTPIPLQMSYRPMICLNLEMAQVEKKHRQHSKEEFDFFDYLDHEMAKIIEECAKNYPGKKPIIRIKIQHFGYEISRWRILQLKYAQKVANPQSIMTFWKRKDEYVDDKAVMDTFRGNNASADLELRQVTEDILQAYVKKQAKKQKYYDPRQLSKMHYNSIIKNTPGAQKRISAFGKTQIQKRSQPIEQEISRNYQFIKKNIDQKVKQDLSSFLELFDSTSKTLAAQNFDEKQTFKMNVEKLWEQKKLQLQVIEHGIKKNVLTTTYGEGLVLEDHKEKKEKAQNKNPSQKEKTLNRTSTFEEKVRYQIPNQQEKMQRITNQKEKHKEKPKPRESSLSSYSFENIDEPSMSLEHQPKYFKMKNSQLKPFKPQKMQIQQQKPVHRPGILKKLKRHSEESSNHDDEEEDCCKRAERTPYDEQRAKTNFEEADSLIRDKKAKANKKDSNQQIKKEVKRQKQYQKKFEKGEKGVRWDDFGDI